MKLPLTLCAWPLHQPAAAFLSEVDHAAAGCDIVYDQILSAIHPASTNASCNFAI